jgi:hypothetical protein
MLGVGVAVGCEVGRSKVDGGGELCSDEQAKRENAKVIVNRTILVFTKKLLIKLLLADGIFQNS